MTAIFKEPMSLATRTRREGARSPPLVTHMQQVGDGQAVCGTERQCSLPMQPHRSKSMHMRTTMDMLRRK